MADDPGAVPAPPAPPPPPLSAPPPRGRRWLGPLPVTTAFLLLVLGGALGGWLGTSGPRGAKVSDASPADAQRLVRSSLDAALAAGSFHYVSSASSEGTSQVTVGDAGPDAGRQNITVDGDTFRVLVVGATAYFEGDASAVSTNLGLPLGLATGHAGQWISLVAGDGPYDSVYAAVTTAQALGDNVSFTPRTRLPESTLGGQRVIAVRGPVKPTAAQPGTGTATLYVQAGGEHLPVRYVEQGHTGAARTSPVLSFTIDFAAWGEPVTVTAPATAVAFSSFAPAGIGPGGSGPGAPITV